MRNGRKQVYMQKPICRFSEIVALYANTTSQISFMPISVYIRLITVLLFTIHSSIVYSESETSTQKSQLKWTQKEAWNRLREALIEDKFGEKVDHEQSIVMTLGLPVYRFVATSFPGLYGTPLYTRGQTRVILCYEMPTFKMSTDGKECIVNYPKKSFISLGEDAQIKEGHVIVHAVDDHRKEYRDKNGNLKYDAKVYTPKLLVNYIEEPDFWQLKSSLTESIPFDASILNDTQRPLWQQPAQWARLKKNMPTGVVEMLLGKPTRKEGGDAEKMGYQPKPAFGSSGFWDYGDGDVGGSLSFRWDDSEGYLDSWTEPFWPYITTLPIQPEAQINMESDPSKITDLTQTVNDEQTAPPWALLSNWEKLNLQMSEIQVTKILGRPTYRVRKRDAIELYYYEGDIPQTEEVPESYTSKYPDALKAYLPKYEVINEDRCLEEAGRISLDLDIIDAFGDDMEEIVDPKKLHKTPVVSGIINPTFSHPPTHYVPYPDYSKILSDNTLEKWQQPLRWERIDKQTSMEKVVMLLGIPKLIGVGYEVTRRSDDGRGLTIYCSDSEELITYQELRDEIKTLRIENCVDFDFVFLYGNVDCYGFVSIECSPRTGKSSVYDLREPFWPLEKKLIDDNQKKVK